MREKKVRGRKRKTDQMVTRIEANTQKFPADIEKDKAIMHSNPIK